MDEVLLRLASRYIKRSENSRDLSSSCANKNLFTSCSFFVTFCVIPTQS